MTAIHPPPPPQPLGSIGDTSLHDIPTPDLLSIAESAVKAQNFVTGDRYWTEVVRRTMTPRDLGSLAFVKEQLRDWDNTLKLYDMAIQRSPENKRAGFLLGKARTFSKMDRKTDALKELDHAIELFPRYDNAIRFRSLIQREVGLEPVNRHQPRNRSRSPAPRCRSRSRSRSRSRHRINDDEYDDPLVYLQRAKENIDSKNCDLAIGRHPPTRTRMCEYRLTLCV